MPFIKGRYYINPVMGEALEAAREAEAALLAIEHESRDGNDQADGFASPNDGEPAPRGPVHRVEIESAEVVPSHSGRAQQGYVARVHRAPSPPTRDGNSRSEGRGLRPDGESGNGTWNLSSAAPPETHVFSDHRDLVNFLRDELAKDCH
jgi:hypothetical protein